MNGKPSALIGRDPAQVSSRSIPVEVEEHLHRRDDRLDATGVERGVVAAELHRAAETNAVVERCRHGVDLFEDDRVREPHARCVQRDVEPDPAIYLEPQAEHPAEGT